MSASIVPIDPQSETTDKPETTSDKPTAQTPANRRRSVCGGELCSALRPFVIITFLAVPALVFFVAAVFGLLLWAVECAALGDSVEGACDYKEWFLYLIGNLVGLGTPLTDVSPDSEHVAAELFDVLIAVWSLSIAGTCIGIIGALAFTSSTTGAFEACLQRRRVVSALTQEGRTGMDLQELKKLVVDKQLGLADAEVEALFGRCDADESGALDEAETRVLIATLDATGKLGQTTSTVQPLQRSSTSADPLRTELAQLQRSVQALHEKIDRLGGGGVGG